jgi:hypothetical protein
MLLALIAALFVLWFFGYIHIQGLQIPDMSLFTINNHVITLWNILILLVIGIIIGELPNPFRAIASVFLVLWVLSVLGIIAFAGLDSILIISLIVGLVLYVITGARA